MGVVIGTLVLLGALVGGLWWWRAQAGASRRSAASGAGRRPGESGAGRRPGAPGASPAQQTGPQRGAAPAAPAAAAAAGQPRALADRAPAGPAPAEFFALPPESLGRFDWWLAEALPDARRAALVAAVGSIPRPPAALHQLLSPQFLERASSQQLSELITGEAQIAAKVLATVNAPFYGLRQPVSGIGQAVTFLGLNTVRSICLRSLLDNAFRPADPALKRAIDEIWSASALASELCNRLASKLGLPDAGALVAQVLLSFLGHLATAQLLAQQAAAAGADGAAALQVHAPLLQRCERAQAQLGLTPAEIGGLLLQGWGLPAPIVDGVRAIDRLLVTPAEALPPEQGQRLAVAHLCARLGEHLATGGPASGGSLAGLAAGLAMADDGFHLRAHLAAPALQRLPEHLLAADLTQPLQALQQGMQRAA